MSDMTFNRTDDYIPGYSVCIRQDKRTGEYLAVIPRSYEGRAGRYYMAIGSSDHVWVELSPEYVTKSTKVATEYPHSIKRTMEKSLGYSLTSVNRVYG